MHLLLYFQYFKTFEYKHFLTKIDKFSIAVPHAIVITLTGLPGLSFLPGLSTLCRIFYLDSHGKFQ